MSNLPTAFLFPGQGAQAVGMGKDLYDAHPVARECFEAASEAIGTSLEKLCFEGPAEELTLTENAQPAILTASVAAWRVFTQSYDANAVAVAMAGHSLGEYSALVAAGAVSLEDAARIVRARGAAMQKAVPAGQGKMAAIMGLDPEKVLAICQASAGDEVVAPANHNAPTQIVIAGSAAAVERACQAAVAEGGKAIPLEVSAPFHCSLMQPAAEELKPVLARATFTECKVPVIRNVDAAPHGSADEIREKLYEQVTSPVRWVDTVMKLQQLGAERFVEVGPGRVLSGLLKRIDRKLAAVNVADCESLEKALASLQAA